MTSRSKWLVCAFAGAFACAGGGGSGVTPVSRGQSPAATARWQEGAYPEGITQATHVIGIGSADTIEAARSLARAQLVQALSAREDWPELGATLQALASERQTEQDGKKLCLLAVERVALSNAVTAAIEQSTPAAEAVLSQQVLGLPSFEAQLRFWLDVLAQAHTRAELCAVAERLGATPCVPLPARQLAEAQVTAMAARLTIEQQPTLGLPYLAGRPGYTPVVVRVMAQPAPGSTQPPLPVAKIPLTLQAPADLFEAKAVVTDAQGQISVPLRRAIAPGDVVAVAVDRVALLGEASAPLWPDQRLPVKLRRLKWDDLRVALELKSASKPRDALVGAARAQLEAALRDKLPGAKLGTVAALAGDRPDLSVSIDVHWTFSSALGGRSMWYEATAALKISNAWSEEVLLQAQERAQEAGIGDSHAAKQAVSKLCAQVADKVAEVVKNSFPTGEGQTALSRGRR